MRNEWNQGRHRPAPTGMDGSAKWNKLLEMQPRQAITAAPHTVLLKAGQSHIKSFVNNNHRSCLLQLCMVS